MAENKKERVRREGTKGRKRDGNRQERVGERETERELWHCHFRSARQPTLCHHDNGEMSYPAGKQGCPRRRGEGKVVMRKKRTRETGEKNRAMEGSKWMKSESLRIYLWERKIERDRDRQIKVAGVTAMVAKATEAVKTLHYLAERNLLASTNVAWQWKSKTTSPKLLITTLIITGAILKLHLHSLNLLCYIHYHSNVWNW